MSALSQSAPPPMPDVMPSSGPLAGGAPQQMPGAQAPQQQAPAPSHEQTVAALRHFHALIKEGQTLLKNPDLGKANVKSAIQDGAIKLVADGIISAADAVTQLASVPDKPFDQKRWVEEQFAQAVINQNHVLEHHRAASPGSGNWDLESAMQKSDPDQHRDVLRGMMEAHYPAGGR